MKLSLPSRILVCFLCLVSLVSGLGNHAVAADEKAETTVLSEQEIKEKALEHARKGQELLKQKSWKDAVSEFEKAIELQPNTSVLHYLLGISYLENSEASKGWVELRKAVLLDPTNKRAATDFMRIWSFFDRKGLLNVGTSEADILKVLGKPDQQRDLDNELQLVYGFMWINFRKGRLFALVDTRGLKVEFTKAVSTLEFQLDPWWKEGYRIMNATNALTEYVAAEDTVQNYQQLFSTQRLFKLGERVSAKEMMNGMKASLEKTHQIEEWNVIQDGDNDILYEWRVAKRGKMPAQHEISRLVRGKRDMHRLAYVSRKMPLSDEVRSHWIKMMESAKLVVAHLEASKLSAAQKKELVDQLTKKSREIITLQLQYIQNLNAEALKPYFTERVRNQITTELLKQAKQQVASASPESLVHSIELSKSDGNFQAKVKMKNGRTLTTLIPVRGKWEADTIWFK